MPVYVDRANIGVRGMSMAHMIADSLDELHAMADRIGMQRSWFQDPKNSTKQTPISFPHYDVAASKRTLAIKFGAIDCDRKTFVDHLRRLRSVFGVYGPGNPAPGVTE